MPFSDPATRRSWTIETNDGIIATAGLLQGFAGAGVSERILVFTAAAALIAGALAVGGASWAENASERDAQLLAMEHERADLDRDPEGEIDELARYWEAKGLSPDLAEQVARQLSAKDALSAQLEWEYGFTEPLPASYPIWFALGAGLAYMVGAAVPLLITYFAPVAIETRAILAAVVVSLALSSVVAARAGRMVSRRVLARTIIVGLLTLAVSYVAGELLLS
ncbi:MAG: VIT1/CCC1 transporter family protein [Microthrixaceae bacterium]